MCGQKNDWIKSHFWMQNCKIQAGWHRHRQAGEPIEDSLRRWGKEKAAAIFHSHNEPARFYHFSVHRRKMHLSGRQGNKQLLEQYQIIWVQFVQCIYVLSSHLKMQTKDLSLNNTLSPKVASWSRVQEKRCKLCEGQILVANIWLVGAIQRVNSPQEMRGEQKIQNQIYLPTQ